MATPIITNILNSHPHLPCSTSLPLVLHSPHAPDLSKCNFYSSHKHNTYPPEIHHLPEPTYSENTRAWSFIVEPGRLSPLETRQASDNQTPNTPQRRMNFLAATTSRTSSPSSGRASYLPTKFPGHETRPRTTFHSVREVSSVTIPR